MFLQSTKFLLFVLFILLLTTKFGFVNSLIIAILIILLSRFIKSISYLIKILYEFTEYIIFAPYRYMFGVKLNQYDYNPLITLLEFDLIKLKRIIKN